MDSERQHRRQSEEQEVECWVLALVARFQNTEPAEILPFLGARSGKSYFRPWSSGSTGKQAKPEANDKIYNTFIFTITQTTLVRRSTIHVPRSRKSSHVGDPP